jgi:SAM-dependent methyltransferase
MGTAKVQGALWGARARDWAEFQEPAWRRIFATALGLAGVRPGHALLDVGCGAGGALMLAREMGAEVAGLDASETLVAVARERLPGASIEIGDMEELPFADARFDIVTGLNAFQFAGDMVKALSEARRVCRADGIVFALTWGPREDCELMQAMVPVLTFLPPPPPGTAPPPAGRDMIGGALLRAGLKPADNGSFAAEISYPGLEAAVRAAMSAGVSVKAAQLVGDERVAEALRAAMAAFVRADGTAAFANRFDWWKAERLPAYANPKL